MMSFGIQGEFGDLFVGGQYQHTNDDENIQVNCYFYLSSIRFLYLFIGYRRGNS